MARIKMSSTTTTTSSNTSKTKNASDEVAKLAYQFFVERGYKHGHDQEDWLRAERIIKARRSNWK